MGKRRGPHTIGKLSATTVARARKRGYLADGGGLYLQVSRTGAKSWVYRYVLDGKLTELGLGPAHSVSLAKARERAAARRQELDAFRHGETSLDPLATRREAKLTARFNAAKAMTFEECAKAYIAAHKSGWRSPKSLAAWEGTLATYVYPVFGKLPVQAVDEGFVLKSIEPIWPTKPETAARVRGRIESILDWATVRKYRAGENPARWRGHLEKALPKKTTVRRVEHLAALPYIEIGVFMAALREQEGIAARALEFAILTAARTGEVRGARWDEIKMAEKLWIIPAERMKAGKEHRVPLSDAALAIIEYMAKRRSSDYVFPGYRSGQPLSNMSMLMLLRRMGHDDLTIHGFRSSFRDWAAECTHFANETVELALAHAIGSKVEAAYRRGDLFPKRRDLAEAWAKFCAGQSTGNVIEARFGDHAA